MDRGAHLIGMGVSRIIREGNEVAIIWASSSPSVSNNGWKKLSTWSGETSVRGSSSSMGLIISVFVANTSSGA